MEQKVIDFAVKMRGQQMIKSVKGDGNCFFRSIGELMSMDHADVRQCAVAEVVNNHEQYSGFVGDVKVWGGDMIQLGTWADGIVVKATANCLNVPIVVFRKQNPEQAPTAFLPPAFDDEPDWRHSVHSLPAHKEPLCVELDEPGAGAEHYNPLVKRATVQDVAAPLRKRLKGKQSPTKDAPDSTSWIPDKSPQIFKRMKKMVDVEELLAVAIKTPEAKKPECSYSAPKCPKPSKAIVLGLDVEDSIAMATELEASLPTIEAEAPIAMELEASLPKEAEASIPMELEAPLLSEAEASIPKELESSLPSEAEASIPMELEKLPSEAFVKLPIVPDEADASILEEKSQKKLVAPKRKRRGYPRSEGMPQQLSRMRRSRMRSLLAHPPMMAALSQGQF